MGENICKPQSRKRWVSKTYKELSKLNNNNDNRLEIGKRHENISTKRIFRWHMKSYSTSLTIREMQIWTTGINYKLSYHYILIMAKIKSSDKIKCWWRCGEVWSLIHFWWEYKMIQSLCKTI